MPYTAYTLTQLTELLTENWDSTPFWTDEEARLALNESIRTWNMLTGMWKLRRTLPTVANQTYYTLPTDIIYPLRMDFNNKPMNQASTFDLDEGHPGWEGQSTADSGIPNVTNHWAPVDFTQFAIWPADAVGNNSLTIDGITNAPILILPTDYINFNSSDLNTLLGFATHVAAFKEGGPRFEGTQSLFKDFLQAASIQNSRLRASSLYRQAMGLDRTQTTIPIEASNGS